MLEEDGDGEAGGEEVVAVGAVGSDLIVVIVVVGEDILEMMRSVGADVEADGEYLLKVFHQARSDNQTVVVGSGLCLEDSDAVERTL